jgi:uncharacterized membrane protein YsdA (DUF1294 family)
MKTLSQINLYEGGGYRGFGNYGLETGATSNAGPLLSSFVSRAIGVITVIAIIWFVFILVSGAISLMSAGADKGAAEGARKRISNGLLGLIVLISGIFVARFVGAFLGIADFINPAILIENISQ